jgi:hypothetical protein
MQYLGYVFARLASQNAQAARVQQAARAHRRGRARRTLRWWGWRSKAARPENGSAVAGWVDERAQRPRRAAGAVWH